MKKLKAKMIFLIFSNIAMFIGIFMIFLQKRINWITFRDFENLRIDLLIYLIYALLLILIGITSNLSLFIWYAYKTFSNEKDN